MLKLSALQMTLEYHGKSAKVLDDMRLGVVLTIHILEKYDENENELTRHIAPSPKEKYAAGADRIGC